MTRPRRALSCASALAVLLAASAARGADPTPAELATANALFQHGKSLLDAHRYTEACPKLEAAQRLVAGIGVTLYLGECYEQTGRPVRAWEQFTRARELAEAAKDARARVARERADRLWPTLAKLTVVVAPAAQVEGLQVTLDGTPLDPVALGVERPTEAGTHHVRARAPDRMPWEVDVDVPSTPAAVRVEVPRLAETERPLAATAPQPEDHAAPAAAAAAEAGSAPIALGAPAPASLAPPPRAERSAPMHPQRVAGLVVFGVGVAGVAAGGVLGVVAKSQTDQSNRDGHCQANDQCDATGLAERADAITKATLSTGAIVAGVACMAGGALLWFTAPDRPPLVAVGASPAPGGGAVLVRGRW